MSFNVGNFIKDTAKSVGNRIIDNVVSQVTSGLPMNLNSSASSTAESLFNAGASFDSISSITSQKTDSLANQGSSVFYALAGKDPVRSSGADIRNLRNIGTNSADFHVFNINPSSAIKAKRKRDAEVILNAVL